MLHYIFSFNIVRPGTYEHQVSRNRKVKYLGTFGGPQTLVTSIRIKCNGNGEKDVVSMKPWFSGK